MGCALRDWGAVAAAAVVGLALLVDGVGRSSATYDEVAYLRIGADWWRTGRQETITRMGSPLTFWKAQQAPVLWALDRSGRGSWIDDPIAHQAQLLPWVRLGALPFWLAALGLTAAWARRLHGPRAMVFSAWLFALSPNLLAHGGLATMELPLVAGSTAVFLLFDAALRHRDRRAFAASALAAGLTLSFKFTAIVLPPLLAIGWLIEGWGGGERISCRLLGRVGLGMTAFCGLMLAANVVVTGGARLPLSERVGLEHPTLGGASAGAWATQLVETPLPQDWVGLATQLRHQRHGGPSYLLGERRIRGWWCYYFVALAVKVPLSFWALAGAAFLSRARERRLVGPGEGLIVGLILGMLALTALGSTRNYGVRYLLPLAPPAIVWVSALAERGRWVRSLAVAGLVGQALAVGSTHPHELTYFNALAGGSSGGRAILSDSNLDWGQGARALARLQRERPELRDLTTYAFGDTDPGHYGVVGRRYVIDAGEVHPDLPRCLVASTEYLAVSASLRWGPWGPDGYFRDLGGLRPVAWTDDGTFAIYRTAELRALNIASD